MKLRENTHKKKKKQLKRHDNNSSFKSVRQFEPTVAIKYAYFQGKNSNLFIIGYCNLDKNKLRFEI